VCVGSSPGGRNKKLSRILVGKLFGKMYKTAEKVLFAAVERDKLVQIKFLDGFMCCEVNVQFVIPESVGRHFNLSNLLKPSGNCMYHLVGKAVTVNFVFFI
jgi:hypothetical protein